MDLIAKDESSEKLYGEVQEVLEELKSLQFFEILRSSVQGEGTFFDPKKEIVSENDDSLANDVLDLYVDEIKSENPLALKKLESRPVRSFYVKALEPDSMTRKILNAYYRIKPTTTWAEASDNIVTQQAHKDDNFPQITELDRIVEELKGSTVTTE